MMELIKVLAFLGLAVFLFRALWWLRLKASAGKQPSPPIGAVAKRCPRCSLPLLAPACEVCHWPRDLDAQMPDAEKAIELLLAQVARLQRLGAIEPLLASKLTDQMGDWLRSKSAPRESDEPILATPINEPADVPLAEPPKSATDSAVPSFAASRQRESFEAAGASPVASAPVSPIAVSRPPRRSWTDWLSAFMEERNMRWGEIVGGMLIVGCSIALIISFWSAIEARPWLQYFLFGGITVSLFGLGIHSERSWRLHTTSQGMLMIACMLVPLNFLAIAAFTSAPGSVNSVTIAGEVLTAAVFSLLVWLSAKILIRRDRLWFTAGIILPAVSSLTVRRFIDGNAELSTLVLVAALPIASYLAANLRHLRSAANAPVLGERRVNALFRLLAVTSFAVYLPLGLLLYKSGHPIATLRDLPGLSGLLGFVPLCTGLLIWDRLAGRSLVGQRTAGTAVAVFGAVVSLAGLVIGWPEPWAIVPAALLQFVLFTIVAWRFAMPAAHILAALCLSVVYVLGAYLWEGQIAWLGNTTQGMARVLVSGETGTLLVPLVMAYAGVALVCRRRNLAPWKAFAASAGLGMLASAGLLARFGLGERGVPLGTDWVYALYAITLLATALRSERAWPAIVGQGLLLTSIVQAVIYHLGPPLGLVQPEVVALLIYGSLGVIVAQVGLSRLAIPTSRLARLARRGTFAVSLAAAGLLLRAIPSTEALWQMTHWAWLAAVWGCVVLLFGWLPVGILFQSALSGAALFAGVAILNRQDWFIHLSHPWRDPWTWLTLALAMTTLNLAWSIARASVSKSAGRMYQRLASPWLCIDRVTTVGLVFLLLALSSLAVLPGIGIELDSSPSRALPTSDSWHPQGYAFEHLCDWKSWTLLGGCLLIIAMSARQGASRFWLYLGFVAVAASCPLAALYFESQHALAIALTWSSTLFLLLMSAMIWLRRPLSAGAAKLGWETLSGDDRARQEATLLVFVLGLLAPVFIAGTICVEVATHSFHDLSRSAGWEIATFFAMTVVVSIAVIWSVAGKNLAAVAATVGRPNWPAASPALLVVMGVIPLVGILLYPLARALAEQPIRGPDFDSLFAALGWPLAYSGPLWIVAIVLVCYAIRERSGGFALGGGLMGNCAVSLAFLMTNTSVVEVAGTWIRLAQLNSAFAAIYTMAWIALAAWDRYREGRFGFTARGVGFDSQLVLAPAISAILLGLVWLTIVSHATLDSHLVVAPEFTDAWGGGSLLLVVLSGWLAAFTSRRPVSRLSANALAVGLLIFAATIVSHWSHAEGAAYHTLYVGHAALATGLVAMVWKGRRLQSEAGGAFLDRQASLWPSLQMALVVVLAMIQVVAETWLGSRGWWPICGLAWVGLLLAPAMACIDRSRGYLYLAAPLVNVSGLLAANQFDWIHAVRGFSYWNVLLAALPVPLWVGIEVVFITRRKSPPWVACPPMHRVSSSLAMLLLTLTVAIGLTLDVRGEGTTGLSSVVNWFALGAVLLALVACLWDKRSSESIPLLYGWGLVACGMVIDHFDLGPPWLLWVGTMILAAYALATSYLWSRRQGLAQFATRLGIRQSSNDAAGHRWLIGFNATLVILVVGMTLSVLLDVSRLDLRLLASLATLAQVITLALLARGERRGILQMGALVVGALGMVYFGWGWLEPGGSFTLPHALVVMGAATVGVGAFYGLGLAKLLADDSDWLPAARAMVPKLAVVSLTSLILTLASEGFRFASDGQVEVAWWASLTVAVTLLALAMAALAAAVLPGRDPLNLSERGRTLYVYAAEAILVLLFLHIRMTLPFLFGGVFRQYWPLVVMAVAFLGVGCGELFRRKQHNVLAVPLENTGTLLPVLPVMGYWVSTSRVDYSLLLLAVGLFYGGLAIARRSFGFGVLAAIAANGGLWFFLGRQDGWGFLAHPQVWMIPPAVCALAAAYLNRQQLSTAQMTAIRYGSSMAIYLASTADIFLNGVAQNPWLPLVLAGISVLGIATGILLRVRAFLFLGMGFLSLALFTIIWYAAVDRQQTWIWFASGILLGLAIMALVALSERKRQHLLEVVENIKQWDA